MGVSSAGTAHVWRFRSNWRAVESLRDMLSERELERANGMTSETARTQFTAAQAALRTVLGWYIGEPPASIEFRYGPHWKPYLADSYASDLQFNLSHSHELGVIGVTRGAEVGIDVERVRERANARRLAQRFYGERERSALDAVDETNRDRTFLRLWTRKEGHLKATGTGLSVSLRDIDTLSPEANGWWYHEFAPQPDYVASLVAQSPPMSVLYFDLV